MPVLWVGWIQIALFTVTELAQVSMRPERPSEFWPVTITGWVTLISSALALGIVIWRANNKPVLDKLVGLEHKFDAEVKRIEKRLDDSEIHREREARPIIKAVDEKMNGFGRRVEENRKDIDRLEMAQGEQALALVESQSDRRQINARISELNSTVGMVVQQLPALEIRINQALTTQTKEILREIGTIVYGNNTKRPER